ncbi:right-handed parallel beta-helix repeat-containing protein [Chitinophaga horti]|uniref:Right-handed parallel beta-helix repeat-containing protein n=1 Tax=Chitinophaga horti TaxID=2920382 RepID=A0ABY6IX41_9BACT|nr:right-handed parallel beta-helix repeat-containing protein [Chitinophaga horti]UYQ91950.1 right-handed parallel beta-helix repeat-containing protein [Chitinophaga horti]
MKYLMLLCCLWTIQQATAATYYVDAINGNDAATGLSDKQAWKSLSRVNAQVFRAGDQLLFRAGRIYEGQLKVQGSGATGMPILIDKYGEGYKPRLQGNGVMPATVHINNVEYWEIRNLDISNNGPERQSSRNGILVQARDVGTMHHIWLSGLDIHDVNGSLLKAGGAGAGIMVQCGGRNVKSRFDGLVIEKCTIRNTHRNGITFAGYWSRQDWFPSLRVIIRDNLLEGVPGDGIVPIGCDSALITRNVIRDCPRLLPDGEAAAGIWPWSCDNTIIEYNEVSDHKAPWDGQGFDSDWNCRNTLIQYNYSHDNEGGFLLVCDDGSQKMPTSAGNTGTVVRYNISINDGSRKTGKHAGFSPVIHLPGPARNTQIYNNMIIVPQREKGIDSSIIAFDNWNGYPDSTLFANNIFYALTPVDYQAAKSTRIYYENNLYFGKHDNAIKDPRAVNADPMFQSLVLGGNPGFEVLKGLKLRPVSAAARKGRPLVKEPAKDFFGNKVMPVKPPDIGVHQF